MERELNCSTTRRRPCAMQIRVGNNSRILKDLLRSWEGDTHRPGETPSTGDLRQQTSTKPRDRNLRKVRSEFFVSCLVFLSFVSCRQEMSTAQRRESVGPCGSYASTQFSVAITWRTLHPASQLPLRARCQRAIRPRRVDWECSACPCASRWRP